ncbi:MAG: hypothetical protein WA323_10660 [Candidatus Nitrosopolaris sp.]
MTIKYVGLIIMIMPFFLSTPHAVIATTTSENKVQILEHLAHTAYDNGNYTLELHLLKQALLLNPKNPRILTNIGAAENDVSNFTDALFYLRQSLLLDPHHTAALFGIASVFDSLGNHSGVLAYFKEVLSLDSKQQPSNNFDLIEKALAFVYLGNYSQATDIINQLSSKPTTNPDIQSTKGVILLNEKNTGALTIFNRILTIHPNLVWALDNAGIALSNLHHYSQALDYFNKSLLLNPRNVNALYNKALTIQKMGYISAAISLYQKVLEITPGNNDALANLQIGMCQRIILNVHVSGNYTEAIRCTDKVLDRYGSGS